MEECGKDIKVPKCTVSYLVCMGYEGGERREWKDRLETYNKIVKCHDRELRGCFGQGGSMKSESELTQSCPTL